MCGVAVDTLRDMEVLYDQIPLDQVTTSMTINGPAIVLLAFYVALADVRGIPEGSHRRHRAERRTEGVHRAARLAGPPASGHAHGHRHDRVLRGRDAALEHGEHQRLSHSRSRGDGRSRAGVHPGRRVGLRESCIERGMAVDTFAPRLSFFFDVHNDFFEEIAKFRAARRMWARFMKERFGAKTDASLKLRTHAQTAGVVAHGAAALQQRRSRGVAGAGRGTGRHAVTAHELAGRDLRLAHRRGRHDRAQHAAGRGARVGRRQHHRSAGWQLLRGVAHQPPRERGPRLHSPHRRNGRDGAGGGKGLPAARDRSQRLRVRAAA